MLGIAFMSYKTGDPRRLAHPYDPDRNIIIFSYITDLANACGGKDTKFEKFPMIYFAEPFPGSLNRTVCVSKCPVETDTKLECIPNSVVKSCKSTTKTKVD